MLTDRIVRALTFRREVYAEVEQDTTFTSTAWILVAVVAFLNQIGSNASGDPLNWLWSTLIGTLFSIIGFGVAAFTISWLGKAFFNADVTFDELVRTMGLAYIWNVVGILGALSAISAGLSCLLSPAIVLSLVMLVISWLVAVKEALDLEWGQTLITVVVGWIAWAVIMLVAGWVRALLGLTAAGVRGLFGI